MYKLEQFKQGEFNPLNVFGLRELTHLPPHFTLVPLSTSHFKVYRDWIYENLSGRFYCGYYCGPSYDDNTGFLQSVVGFENPGEASFFALVKDQILK